MPRNVMVLVGIGQLRNRPGLDSPQWEPREPARLMAEALELAIRDAGAPQLAREADLLGCVPAIAWTYADMPARVAELAGAKQAETVVGSFGGESPIRLLNEVANRIERGETRIALLAGAETFYSWRRARREGRELSDWTPRQEKLPRAMLEQKPLASPFEVRHGLRAPIEIYPLYENALRAKAGRSIEAHQVRVSELMARYSAAAAKNPYAWFPEPRTAEQIRTVGESNRMICFPYPKLMNAIMEVDQAAAIIAMSETEADRLGIPSERRVYYLGGAGAHDAWNATERVDFVSSPAYAAAASKAAGHAGIEIADVDLFDLYSCFPSAVELALDALGVSTDDPRPPTQTGGLAHFGGPGNDYALHSVASVVGGLREAAGRVGWVSGLGMTATKHAIAVLGSDPARARAADGISTHVTLPEEQRTGPELVEAPDAKARIETYTVAFGRDGKPERGMLVLRLADGRRSLANAEPQDLTRLVASEGVGLRGRVTPGAGDAPNSFRLEA